MTEEKKDHSAIKQDKKTKEPKEDKVNGVSSREGGLGQKTDYKEKAVEMEHKYMTALADFQNLIKRTEQEKQAFVKYANENILNDFIPVYDNLKISLEHVTEKDKENPWVKGIEYVIKMFKDLLEANGVKEIETKGKKFDPKTMEAIEGEGENIAKEISAGYELNGRIIKPARVKLEE